MAEGTMEALRDELVTAAGLTQEEAERSLGMLIAMNPSIAAGKLPALVTLVAERMEWPRVRVIEWMLSTLALEHDELGRELVYAAGVRTAIRWGAAMPSAVVQAMQANGEKPPERGH